MIARYKFCTHPSLALIKYWGKRSVAKNIPATSSIAVALNACRTTVTVTKRKHERAHSVVCDGMPSPEEILARYYAPFFAHCRAAFGEERDYWKVEIENSYPLAAGLASSSAIFAAIALALNALYSSRRTLRQLSALARQGSASAARAIFGGIVALPAGARYARPYLPSSHWPELRVIIVQCARGKKEISSRVAMRRAKETSPLFKRWEGISAQWYREAKRALLMRDLEQLGVMMQQSYLTMFATMHTSIPPIFYWNAKSIEIIKMCQRLRQENLALWETMDAGPQVKILTTAAHVDRIVRALNDEISPDALIVSQLGADPAEIPIVTGESHSSPAASPTTSIHNEYSR